MWLRAMAFSPLGHAVVVAERDGVLEGPVELVAVATAVRRRCGRTGASASSLNGLSERGRIHWGVRWYTSTCTAAFATSGTICAALAPVPITATRLPASSCSCSQRAEWNEGPPKESSPAMSGVDGVAKVPTALTSTSDS